MACRTTSTRERAMACASRSRRALVCSSRRKLCWRIIRGSPDCRVGAPAGVIGLLCAPFSSRAGTCCGGQTRAGGDREIGQAMLLGVESNGVCQTIACAVRAVRLALEDLQVAAAVIAQRLGVCNDENPVLVAQGFALVAGLVLEVVANKLAHDDPFLRKGLSRAGRVVKTRP